MADGESWRILRAKLKIHAHGAGGHVMYPFYITK